MSDSQSSTDTALSSNDATTPTNNHNDKAKCDGEENMENGGPLLKILLNRYSSIMSKIYTKEQIFLFL